MGQKGQHVCDYCGIVFKKRRRANSNYCSLSCYIKAREKAYKQKFIDIFGDSYDFIALKDGYVIFECKQCHNILKRQAKQVFYSFNGCPSCKEEQRQHINAIKDLIKELNKIISNKEKQQIQAERQNEIAEARSLIRYKHTCIECGKEFESKSKRGSYCCKSCMRRKYNKIHELQRENRIKNNGCVDSGITVTRLIAMDNNICHICGEECDIEDYKIINGVFIAGNNYPSIDHIKPLSRGGTHTWNNVKLAHMYCNSTKGVKYPPAGS